MEEVKSLSPKEWQRVKKYLDRIGGYAEFRIDGYEVKYRLTRLKMRLVIMTYVNGKTALLENDDAAKRFYFPRFYRLWSNRALADLRKKCGKRYVEKQGLAKEGVLQPWPFWNSFAALKKHLIANNKSIELLDTGDFGVFGVAYQ